MKILIVHNSYQNAGGEDSVVAAESRLLQEAGHRLVWYTRDNHELLNQGALQSVASGLATVWSPSSHRAIRGLLQRECPDVAHFHNTFPLISPSAYYACAHEGVPVVQTLHNYRLLCPSALLFREGQVCEDCVGRSFPWPGLLHRCYRDDLFATAAVTGMLTTHRLLGSWTTKVNRFIALSQFAKDKFVAGGLPVDRIFVKPNIVHPDPGPRELAGGYALFVGRLSAEKGVATVLEAWRRLKSRVPLVIAGAGPLQSDVAAAISQQPTNLITAVGHVGRDEILGLLRRAHFLVFPSVLYENFPVSIAEAFACGVPAIASRLGAMREIVNDHRTGLLFEPVNPADLAAKVEWAWAHPESTQEMGRNARAEYEAKYTAGRGLNALLSIYESAIGSRTRGATANLASQRTVPPAHSTSAHLDCANAPSGRASHR
jgi:glycosyltransferase involved in cell wall biosynthesis